MAENLERQIIELVATDRIYVPMSSFDGKLKRNRPKLANLVYDNEDFHDEGLDFQGDRAYARFESVDKEKARGMREGVEQFSKQFPKYGEILEGIIKEKRSENEQHLYFGMNEGKRLTQSDYMNVMTDLGLSYERAEQFYPVVMDISRNLSRKRSEDRSVLIGKG